MRDGIRVFVTGATGFIGRRLVDELLRRGCRVVALVRAPEALRAAEIAAQGAQLVAGDVTDRESLREGMARADVVIHAAGVYELGVAGDERQHMTAVNVHGTDNVLGLALELRVPRVLHLSTVMVWGESAGATRDEHFERRAAFASHYEWTKTEAHRLALEYAARGLPLVVACPNGVVGANDHSVMGYFLRLHLNHLMPPLAPCPDTMLPLAHVDDVARGLAAAALQGRPGRTYVFSGERTTLRQIFELWRDEIPGGMAIRWWVPQWTGWLMFAPVGPLLRLAGLSAFLSAETARMAGRDLDFASPRTRTELGWVPRPAREMWRAVGQAERRLMAQRRGQTLAMRLRPLEAV